MPSSIQIVPEYSFPYVKTVVNDNTTKNNINDDIVNDAGVDILNYIAVFTSGKGIDGKLIKKTSLNDLHKSYGQSNYKLYGQPYMMAEAILSNSNTNVWCMRVMPEDSGYAHSIVSLWYKADKANKKFNIKFTQKAFDGKADMTNFNLDHDVDLHDLDDIKTCAEKFDGTDIDGVYTDSDGYTQVPFMLVNSEGRGKYGNDVRWRISINTDYEKKYGTKLYTFEIIDTDGGATTIAKYIGGIATSTKMTGATLINDVIADATTGKVPVSFHLFDENVEALYEKYVEFCKEVMAENPELTAVLPTLDEFDPIFGKNVSQNKTKVTGNQPFINVMTEVYTEAELNKMYEGFKNAEIQKLYDAYVIDHPDVDIETWKAGDGASEIASIIDIDAWKAANGYLTATNNESFVTLDDVSGNLLYNGTDGSFDKSVDPEIRNAAINQAYIDAFNGKTDKLILAPRRIQSESLFDANYPMDVKKALVKLALFRQDAICYVDTGTDIDTLTDDAIPMENAFDDIIDELDEEFKTLANQIIDINLHSFKVREPSTGKRVDVTVTYFLAMNEPAHIAKYGRYTPMVNNYAILSGHIKNSLKPSIELYEKELMDRLNLSRINYFECTDEDTFVRSTQNVYQAAESDLLEENNVRTLLWLRRNIEADIRTTHYDFTSGQIRKDFADFIKAKYKYMVGRDLYSLDITYNVNEFEYNHSIVHAYLAVTFRPMAKQTILEIDVNQNMYDDELVNAAE